VGRVFVSHSTKDDAFVIRLVNDLKSQYIDTFVDHDDIKSGQRWPDEIYRALNQCDQMIAVISPDSIESQNCKNEWFTFFSDNKEVIPVWLRGDKLYFQFQTIQFVDFRNEPDYRNNLKKLIEYLADDFFSVGKPENLKQVSLSSPEDILPSQLRLKYTLKRINDKSKSVGIATGNIAELKGVDVLVNSENSTLRMGRPKERSVSAALNAFSAEYDEQGEEISSPVEEELREKKREFPGAVPFASVVVTSPGNLHRNGVRHIFHAVSVKPKLLNTDGYEPGSKIQLSRCVTNSLNTLDKWNRETYSDDPLKTIVFPVFGAGDGGLTIDMIAERFIEQAIDYLETENTEVEGIYFIAYLRKHYDQLKTIFDAIPDLDQPEDIDSAGVWLQ
jgi:O-acetyl-ADP-ribose deacetylase (regulator of RNase III)